MLGHKGVPSEVNAVGRVVCPYSVNGHRCLCFKVLRVARHFSFLSFSEVLLATSTNLPVTACSRSLVNASNLVWARNRQPHLLELQMSIMARQGLYSDAFASELIHRLWGPGELTHRWE